MGVDGLLDNTIGAEVLEFKPETSAGQ